MLVEGLFTERLIILLIRMLLFTLRIYKILGFLILVPGGFVCSFVCLLGFVLFSCFLFLSSFLAIQLRRTLVTYENALWTAWKGLLMSVEKSLINFRGFETSSKNPVKFVVWFVLFRFCLGVRGFFLFVTFSFCFRFFGLVVLCRVFSFVHVCVWVVFVFAFFSFLLEVCLLLCCLMYLFCSTLQEKAQNKTDWL